MSTSTDLSCAQPPFARLTVIAEHLDPQIDLSAIAALSLIQALAQQGLPVTVRCGYCPAGVLPEHILVDQMGAVPVAVHRLIRLRQWAKPDLSLTDRDPVLSLTPLIRGDVNLLLAGTEHARLKQAAQDNGGGAFAAIRSIAMAAKPGVLLRKYCERKLLKDPAAHLAVTSQAARQEVQQLAGQPGLTVTSVPPAVAPHAVEPEQVDEWQQSLRQGLGIKPDTAIVLFPASQPLAHGFGPLMLALRQLRDRSLPVVVLLAGRYRYTHLAWIAQVGVRDAVRFVGPTRRLEALYACADVVAHPTYHDPSGQAVLLALAAGKPVVTTGACAAAHYLPGGDAADLPVILLDGPEPVDALAQSLQRLLDPVGGDAWARWCEKTANELAPAAQARAALACLADARSAALKQAPGIGE